MIKDTWDTGEKCLIAEDCSWADDKKACPIILTPEVWGTILKLCEDVDLEWQMLLTGTDTEDAVTCTGYWIPKQEVTGSSVKNLDIIDSKVIEERGIVATIHSHSSMGVFFSSTDEQFTNMSLIKTHIVVNNKGETVATMRYETPCGMSKFFETIVKVTTPDIPEIVGRDNIEVHKSSPIIYAGKGMYADEYWYGKEFNDIPGGKRKKGKKVHALNYGKEK